MKVILLIIISFLSIAHLIYAVKNGSNERNNISFEANPFTYEIDIPWDNPDRYYEAVINSSAFGIYEEEAYEEEVFEEIPEKININITLLGTVISSSNSFAFINKGFTNATVSIGDVLQVF